MDTAERVSECAKRINRFGPDSEEVRQFIAENRHDSEFVELAELSRVLKRAVNQKARKPAAQPARVGPGPDNPR